MQNELFFNVQTSPDTGNMSSMDFLSQTKAYSQHELGKHVDVMILRPSPTTSREIPHQLSQLEDDFIWQRAAVNKAVWKNGGLISIQRVGGWSERILALSTSSKCYSFVFEGLISSWSHSICQLPASNLQGRALATQPAQLSGSCYYIIHIIVYLKAFQCGWSTVGRTGGRQQDVSKDPRLSLCPLTSPHFLHFT